MMMIMMIKTARKEWLATVDIPADAEGYLAARWKALFFDQLLALLCNDDQSVSQTMATSYW
jgi:hypothetical protein